MVQFTKEASEKSVGRTVFRGCDRTRWSDEAYSPIRSLGRSRKFRLAGQAEQVLQDRLRLFNSSEYRPSSSCTLRGLCRESLAAGSATYTQYSTKKHYQYILRVHVYPALGDMQLRLINRDVVQGLFLRSFVAGCPGERSKVYGPLFGTVMGAAEMAELIPSNPVRKTRFPRRGPRKQRAEIAPEKIRELLDALPEPSRSLAWLLVLTGLRIGELLALRWRNIDLEKARIEGDCKVSTMVTSMFPRLQAASVRFHWGRRLSRFLRRASRAATNPEALVFEPAYGNPVRPAQSHQSAAQAILQEAGIVGVTWHWLRHANATLLDAVGTPLGTVQALLGHSSPEITREVYLHSIPADARAAVEKVEDLLNRPKLTQVAISWGNGSPLIQ